MIFGYFDKAEWAALAQIDGDCRQLACSHQFHTLLLNYNPASIGLLDQFAAEISSAEALTEQIPIKSQPSIGLCVRCITVSTDSKWLFSITELTPVRPFAKKARMLKEANSKTVCCHIGDISTILKSYS